MTGPRAHGASARRAAGQAAELVLFLASGQADALSGRLINGSDDLAALLSQHPGKPR
ncbi:MAG: hypothetical protein JOZ15_08620 [Acidobacteria bacterium]|nr:hypothetical protein [Acidobacteriota bacterium]